MSFQSAKECAAHGGLPLRKLVRSRSPAVTRHTIMDFRALSSCQFSEEGAVWPTRPKPQSAAHLGI
jgi:hypothetical protein